MSKLVGAFARPDDRNVYRPSGRVNWALFLPGAALTLGTAALMALALAYLGTRGWHIILFAPLLLVAPAAFALYGAVRVGHCRNPLLAGLLGVVVGLIVGVGHYHAELVIRTGPVALSRVDLLPEWINFQMQNYGGRPRQCQESGWAGYRRHLFQLVLFGAGGGVLRRGRGGCRRQGGDPRLRRALRSVGRSPQRGVPFQRGTNAGRRPGEPLPGRH